MTSALAHPEVVALRPPVEFACDECLVASIVCRGFICTRSSCHKEIKIIDVDGDVARLLADSLFAAEIDAVDVTLPDRGVSTSLVDSSSRFQFLRCAQSPS